MQGRKQILEVHAKGKPVLPDLDLEVIARRTPGFTGADLANVLNEGALLTARSGGKLVDLATLEEAIDRVMAGPQRRTRLMSDKEKKVTAYHEAGHALVAHALPNTDPVHKITILPRGRALGYTMVLPTEDKYSQSRAELLDMLAYAMGGRAAEELVFHDPTTGAQQRHREGHRHGPRDGHAVRHERAPRCGEVRQESGEVFMGKDMGHGRDYSEEVAAQVDSEVRALVENAHHEAWEILVEYRDVLDDMVLKLLDKETLNKEEVMEIFAPVSKRPPRDHPTGNGRRPLSTRPPVLTPAELAVMGPADLAELEDLARGRKPAGAPAKATSRRRAPAADAPSRSRATVNRAANAARKATGTARSAQAPESAPAAPVVPPPLDPGKGPAARPRTVQPPAARRPRRATGTDPAS
jgi:cell division protease FtsH